MVVPGRRAAGPGAGGEQHDRRDDRADGGEVRDAGAEPGHGERRQPRGRGGAGQPEVMPREHAMPPGRQSAPPGEHGVPPGGRSVTGRSPAISASTATTPAGIAPAGTALPGAVV